MVTTGSEPRAAEKASLLERYDNQIDWYWTNSGRQKRRFIYTRFTILVLGALVTLIASLAAATFVEESSFWDTIFKILTPILAAVLAVITGLTQTFQWGAAWREMNLAAMALEKERDRIRLTPAYKVDAVAEIERFNDLVIDETRRYFERVTAAARSEEMQAQVTAAAEAAVASVLVSRSRDVNLAPSAPASDASEYSDAQDAAPATSEGSDYSDAQYMTSEAAVDYSTPEASAAPAIDDYGAEGDDGAELAEEEGEGGSPFAGAGDGEGDGEGWTPFAAEEGGEEGDGGSPFAAGEGEDEEQP